MAFTALRKTAGLTVRSISEGTGQATKFVMESTLPTETSSWPAAFINFINPYFGLSDLDKKNQNVVRNTLCKTAEVASTSNLTLPWVQNDPSFIIDGVTLSVGNTILLKDQTTASENGLYTVNSIDSTDPSQNKLNLQRSAAASFADQMNNLTVYIVGGDTNSKKSWTQVTQDPNVGTDQIKFVSWPSFWDNFLSIVCTVLVEETVVIEQTHHLVYSAWDGSVNYTSGEIVGGQDGLIYRAISDIPPAIPNLSPQWRKIPFLPWTLTTSFTVGQVVQNSNGDYFIAAVDVAAGGSMPTTSVHPAWTPITVTTWSIESTYLQDAYVNVPTDPQSIYSANANIIDVRPSHNVLWQPYQQQVFANVPAGIKTSLIESDGLSIIRHLTILNGFDAIQIRTEDGSPIPQWYVDKLIIPTGLVVQ